MGSITDFFTMALVCGAIYTICLVSYRTYKRMLPYLVLYAVPLRGVVQRATKKTVRTNPLGIDPTLETLLTSAPSVVADPPVGDQSSMHFSMFVETINTNRDTHAHLFVRGATGSGKTCFVNALMMQLKDCGFVIIDPKPARPSQKKWGGLPYITTDDDLTLTSVKSTLLALMTEARRRRVALRKDTESQPLFIIVDEFPMVVRECGDVAREFFSSISRVGRELNMRLIIISQSDRVKTLGISGEGDIRESYCYIQYYKDHTAVMIWEDTITPLDTTCVPDMLQNGVQIDPGRIWQQDNDLELVSSMVVVKDGDIKGLVRMLEDTGWSKKSIQKTLRIQYVESERVA